VHVGVQEFEARVVDGDVGFAPVDGLGHHVEASVAASLIQIVDQRRGGAADAAANVEDGVVRLQAGLDEELLELLAHPNKVGVRRADQMPELLRGLESVGIGRGDLRRGGGRRGHQGAAQAAQHRTQGRGCGVAQRRQKARHPIPFRSEAGGP
jgi:hypothetical protein